MLFTVNHRISGILVTCIISAVLIFSPVTTLSIRVQGNKGILHAIAVEPGDSIRLTWIHSVSKRPISETYSVSQAGLLCLIAMQFDHEGPGLPSYPEEKTVWRIEQGRVIVTGFSSCPEQLNMAITTPHHLIIVREHALDLTTCIGPHRLISMSIEKLPLFKVLRQRLCDGVI